MVNWEGNTEESEEEDVGLVSVVLGAGQRVEGLSGQLNCTEMFSRCTSVRATTVRRPAFEP